MTHSENKTLIPLRVLVVEDSEDDTMLVLREIRRGGYEPLSLRVQTADELRNALAKQQWDLVISDFSMPDFDGLSALNILRENGLDIPFILVSGTISEETAVTSLKAGAQDFMIKLNLARLIPAIDRELKEAEMRRERRRMQEELEAYHAGLEKKVEERTAELISARKEAEQALLQLRTVVESMGEGVLVCDTAGKIISFNSALLSMFDAKDAPRGNFQEYADRLNLLESEGRAVPLEEWPLSRALRGKAVRNQELLVHVPQSGKLYTALYSANPVHDSAGRLIQAVLTVRDITERKRMEQALRESEARYRTLFNSIDEGFCIVEVIFDENEKPVDYRFLETNPSFEKQTGLAEALGKRMRDLAPKHEEFWFDTYGKIALTGQPARFQNRAEQLHRWFDVYAFRFGRPEDRQVAILLNDITKRKQMEHDIAHMAHHDALTGLPNRRLFGDILKVELAQARRYKSKLAVLFLDLDRFKDINDTLGHEAGDLLLREVADRLRKTIREVDTVGRIGGDEFNIVMADIFRTEDIGNFAQKIIDSLHSPIAIDGTELHVTTSIGISVYPDDSEDIDVLRRYADIAMYHAKEGGRDRYEFYNSAINTRSLERMRFENTLRRAIEHDELRLYYQPMIDVKSKTVISGEVLVRWQHPERGLLLPEQFFGAAEDIGFMPEIDEWVLKAAARQIKKWIEGGLSPLCVTVNVSAREFERPDMVKRISNMLHETGLQPGCLSMEITETVAMRNIESTVSRLAELRNLGVQVSIDDFGTGFSSLSQLKRLPIQKLKIDRSFVRDIAHNSDDRKIITAVLLLAHSMNLKVVAEGVEDDTQYGFLRALDCDEAQGFLFSRPVPADEFEKLIVSGK